MKKGLLIGCLSMVILFAIFIILSPIRIIFYPKYLAYHKSQ